MQKEDVWMLSKIFIFILAFLLSATSVFGAGGAYSYDNKNTVIGIKQLYKIKKDESLLEVARNFGLGYNEIVNANPDIDPWVPETGRVVVLPTIWILPDAKDEGIVINLAEMRLYYYLNVRGNKLVRTFPIGIGSEGFDTPTGIYRIIEKIENPEWHVPESIRKEKPQLPLVVKPGPKNPLGSHAIRLSAPNYLIHGTNKPWGVGRRVSHGCIRLYPEDIPKLYALVKLRSKVNIVYQPIKIGVKDETVYIEVHEDYMRRIKNPYAEAISLLKQHGLPGGIQRELLKKALKEKRGIPTPLSK